MEDIYAEIIKALEKREKLALATLITRVGSAPRGVGAKYLIKEDGSSFGLHRRGMCRGRSMAGGSGGDEIRRGRCPPFHT